MLCIKCASLRIVQNVEQSRCAFTFEACKVLSEFLFLSGVFALCQQSKLAHKEIVVARGWNTLRDELAHSFLGTGLIGLLGDVSEALLDEACQVDNHLVSWAKNLEVFKHNICAIHIKCLINDVLIIARFWVVRLLGAEGDHRNATGLVEGVHFTHAGVVRDKGGILRETKSVSVSRDGDILTTIIKKLRLKN